MATEAAALFVRVTADIADANRKLDAISTKTEKTGSILHNALGSAIGFGASTLALAGMGDAIGFLKGGIVDMNANLEKSTIQFSSLGLTSEQATKHVASLFEFAKKTPFETGPIIAASKYLQQFGGGALNTTKNLTMIGDASAASGADIAELSMWTGRLYGGLQAGRPVGEAMMRMQELGVMSADTRNQIEKMQKEGVKGSKVWEFYAKSLGKFGGAMEKQAGTWEGLTSTLSDTLNLTLASAARPFFEGMKSGLQGLIGLFSSEAFSSGLTNVANGIVTAFGAIGDAMALVWTIAQPVINALVTAFAPVVATITTGLTSLANTLTSLGVAFGFIAAPLDAVESGMSGVSLSASNLGPMVATAFQSVLTAIGSLIAQVIPKLAELGRQFVAWIAPMIPPALEALGAFLVSMLTWVTEHVGDIADTLLGWASAFINWIAPMIPPFLAQLAKWGLAAASWVVTTGIPMVAKALVKLAEKFIDWIGPMVNKLPGALLSFATAVVTWLVNVAGPTIMPKVLDLGAKMIDWLVKSLIALPGKLAEYVGKYLIPAIQAWGPRLAKAAGEIAEAFVTAFIRWLSKLPGQVADTIRSAFANLNINVGPFHISGAGVRIDLPKIDFPKFAEGAANVPFTGPAIVHKGEMVLPADLAKRIRGGAGLAGSSVQRGGGALTLNVHIGSFYGTEDNIRDLTRRLGEEVRYATLRAAPA